MPYRWYPKLVVISIDGFAMVSQEEPMNNSSSDWLTDDICQQIVHMLKQPSDEESRRFRLANRKKLYKGGKLDQPFFCLGEVHHRTVLCRILYTRGRIDSRQVVTAEQAYQIVLKLHQDVHSNGRNQCNSGSVYHDLLL